MYICIYTYIYIYIYICVYIFLYVYIHIYIMCVWTHQWTTLKQIYIYVCIHTYMTIRTLTSCIFVYLPIYVCALINRLPVYRCMYIYVHIHTYMYTHIFIYMYICMLYIYIYNAPINGPPINYCVRVCVRACACVCVHTFASVNALDHVAFFEAARRVGNADYRHLLVAGVSPQLYTWRHDARGSLVGFRPRYARHVCMRIIVMAWMRVWMLVLTITSTLHAVSVFNVVVAAMLLLLLLLLLLLWVVVKGSG